MMEDIVLAGTHAVDAEIAVVSMQTGPIKFGYIGDRNWIVMI